MSKNTAPRSAAHPATTAVCAASQPPSAQSLAEKRTVRAALGAASRTASTTRSSSRARFSSEPPYSSVRVFDSGERNWCSR